MHILPPLRATVRLAYSCYATEQMMIRRPKLESWVSGAEIVLIHEGGRFCGTALSCRRRADPCHDLSAGSAAGDGGAYMVVPTFGWRRQGHPRSHLRLAVGSGKRLYLHSCSGCATKLYVTLSGSHSRHLAVHLTIQLGSDRVNQRTPHLHRHRAP